MIFLSIFAATCRPNNLIQFLNNLTHTCDDPSSFEVLLKIDEGDDQLTTLIEDYKKTSNLNIKYLATAKLDGYYSLDVGYNELLKIVDQDTYFCWLLTDEIRLETKGWDTALKKYIKLYPDDIFRLKMSIFALKNYNDLFECLPCPDNYAVTTRKWLEITDGWGNFWGPDSWHQCIDYYLGFCKNASNPHGIWRSIPIFDIKVGGQEAGQGIVNEGAQLLREKKIHAGWRKFSTHKAQENYYRLAQRLNCHIAAIQLSLDQYIIHEDYSNKSISLYNINHKMLSFLEYHLPAFKVSFITGKNILRLNQFINISQFIFLRKIKRKIKKFYNETKNDLHQKKMTLLNTINTPKRIFRKILVDLNILKIKSSRKKSMRYIYDGKSFKPLNETSMQQS